MRYDSFDEWMQEVDEQLCAVTGLFSDDLADIGYRDLYEDGAEPIDAVIEALEQNGYPPEALEEAGWAEMRHAVEAYERYEADR
jgi:hypothetical protein